VADRKIISVGFICPGGEIEYLPLHSDRSLLDADIILFKPNIDYNYISDEEYSGKVLLNQRRSFSAVEAASHWRSELKAAYEGGKVVVVYLSKPVDVFVYTGDKTFSGTGKSRTTTNIVRPFSSYDALPYRFDKITPKGGEVIIPSADLGYLTGYWKDFAKYSKYEVYFEGKFSHVFLTTKTGEKVIGAAVQNKGIMLFLPPFHYDEDDFYESDGESDEKWTTEGIAFGKRLIASLVAIDKAIRGDRNVAPAPEWVHESQFRLKAEAEVEARIKDVSAQIDALKVEKTDLTSRLEAEGSLRVLLYGTGHELEAAILEALQLMGFKAETYNDSESEFDAVFVSPEGRFLGEAEGKDNKAINIDKLSQLERNIQEDFNREEVTDYAKGVLFGNAYRLLPPSDRQEFFTLKCLSGAQRSKTALVRTPDLFPAAKYLKENKDDDFAQRCRYAIKNSEGEIVQFPLLPDSNELAETTMVAALIDESENNMDNVVETG
jgi:hypothetical protein